MFEAMRLACYESRAQSPDPAEWLCAEQALVMATRGSARALGMQGTIGKLAQGSKATSPSSTSQVSPACP
jgi:cytosine/adenosine deaminase-related metal-dependent hydrolase